MDDKMKLIIEIKNTRPIEVMDLAQSMMSIGGEYQHYLEMHASHLEADKTRLYVKEVRTGSVITELVALAPFALPLIEHADSILEYAKYLGMAYDWLIGRSSEKEIVPFDKTTLHNLSAIIEPVVKDNAAQLVLTGLTNYGEINFSFNMNSTEANAAQNTIRRHLIEMKEPMTGVHEQVVLYWAQARNKSTGKAGDRAIIESLYKGDVKVRFASDELKSRMLFDEPHPFNKAFVVDVSVETINDKPVLYKVLQLHEVLEQESAN